jgi:hypothetical protein
MTKDYILAQTSGAIERGVCMILNSTSREHDGKHDAEGLTALVEAAKKYAKCQSHLFYDSEE